MRIDGGARGTVADGQMWIPDPDGVPVLVNTDYLIIEDDLGEQVDLKVYEMINHEIS